MTYQACLLSALALLATPTGALAQAPMQTVGRFQIDATEVTIGQFKLYADSTKTITSAERSGGGSTYEAGWVQRKGWTWRAPFGTPGGAKEPAVHISYPEAQAFCQWAGKRLPTDAEWAEAAYTERRSAPSDGFITGRSYRYPTGDSPAGANCLADCGSTKTVLGATATALTSRGRGHAEAGSTKAGVNGLFEMGANAWEWVDSGVGGEKRTRGGSWWYGASAMLADHLQSKPADTAVVYIGFRCAKDL